MTYELDIVFMNHKEDDIEEVCVTSNYVTKGRLLFRMANVGYPFFSMERLVPGS